MRKRNRRVLKGITIFLGAFYIPVSVYIGFCFGSGQELRGIIALSCYTIAALIDGIIFWSLIERR